MWQPKLYMHMYQCKFFHESAMPVVIYNILWSTLVSYASYAKHSRQLCESAMPVVKWITYFNSPVVKHSRQFIWSSSIQSTSSNMMPLILVAKKNLRSKNRVYHMIHEILFEIYLVCAATPCHKVSGLSETCCAPPLSTSPAASWSCTASSSINKNQIRTSKQTKSHANNHSYKESCKTATFAVTSSSAEHVSIAAIHQVRK